MNNYNVKIKKYKIIILILIISILFQILTPLLSFAIDGESQGTSLGKIKITSLATSINEGDIVPVCIYVEGNNVYATYGEFSYDRDIFEDITRDDIVVEPYGWKHLIKVNYGEKGFELEIGKGDNGELQSGYFKLATINLKAKKTTTDSTNFAIYYGCITVKENGKGRDTWDECPDGMEVNYNFTPEPSTPVPTTYTVSYDANASDVVAPASATVDENTTYTVAANLTRPGYTFKGWSADGVIYGGDSSNPTSFTVTKDVTLVAQWEAIPVVPTTYTVSYEAGTTDVVLGMPSSATVNENATFTVTPAKPVRSGYNFKGWSANGVVYGGESYNPTSFVVTGNVTLVAQWEAMPTPEVPNTYDIVYMAGTTDNVTNMPPAGTKTEGQAYIITGAKPVRSGYTFKEWNTKEDGTGTTYLSGSNYTIDQNLTLYAQWEEVPVLENLYLSTEVYKIGDNDIKNYEAGDKYISRIVRETKLEDYINNLDTNGEIRVIKEDGTDLQNGEYVGTGMTLLVTKDEEKIELKIAVMGDLDGDGKVTASDLSTMNKCIQRLISLENEYRIAADLDESDIISATDLSIINKYILGIL